MAAASPFRGSVGLGYLNSCGRKTSKMLIMSMQSNREKRPVIVSFSRVHSRPKTNENGWLSLLGDNRLKKRAWKRSACAFAIVALHLTTKHQWSMMQEKEIQKTKGKVSCTKGQWAEENIERGVGQKRTKHWTPGLVDHIQAHRSAPINPQKAKARRNY